jgi:hypothetical protein
MSERSAGLPILGLLFLAAVATGVGWAATAETGPVIDTAPSATLVRQAVAGDKPADAAASRMAELEQRSRRTS